MNTELIKIMAATHESIKILTNIYRNEDKNYFEKINKCLDDHKFFYLPSKMLSYYNTGALLNKNSMDVVQIKNAKEFTILFVIEKISDNEFDLYCFNNSYNSE